MEAFVTLATTDAYALGALVLAQSIRQVGTTRKLVVMITKSLSDLIRSLPSRFVSTEGESLLLLLLLV